MWSSPQRLDRLAQVSRSPSPAPKKQGFTLKKPGENSGNRDPKNLSRPPGIAVNEGVPIQPDTSGWITRNKAADLMRVSVTTIANYERRGKLHPRYAYRADSRGVEHYVAVYNPEELFKEIPRGHERPATNRDPGETAARAFEHFDQGLTVRQIVIELRETPDRVHELRESWLNAGGAALTITDIAKQKFEQLVGPFTGVTELLELIEKLVGSPRSPTASDDSDSNA